MDTTENITPSFGVSKMWSDFWETRDPRVENWLLLSSPLYPAVGALLYVLFVTKIGPKFMENRKPFEFKHTLNVYNLSQVIISMWLVYETLANGWLTHYSWLCQPVEKDTDPASPAMRMAVATWIYYLNKYVELLDTIFFVLRKKTNQVTFLHVYHHAMMPNYAFIMTRWIPGGHESLAAPINCAVHVVMYSYYFLAAQGPWIQPYLWWKKYITQFQLVQFVIDFSHSLVFLIGLVMGMDYATQCGYPWQMTVLACVTLYIPFFILFAKFYVASFTKAKPKQKAN